MFLRDSVENVKVVGHPLPQREPARRAQTAEFRLQQGGFRRGARSRHDIVNVSVRFQSDCCSREPRTFVVCELVQGSDRQERSAGQTVCDRRQTVFVNVTGDIMPLENSLLIAVFGVNEDLTVHFFDVGDQRVAVPTPTQQHVSESWQEIGAYKQLRVQ